MPSTEPSLMAIVADRRDAKLMQGRVYISQNARRSYTQRYVAMYYPVPITSLDRKLDAGIETWKWLQDNPDELLALLVDVNAIP